MNNENGNFFWDRTKALIKEKNTTQDWLAQQCGVTVGVFKSWIYDKRLPDAAQAARIAQALNTSVEYLVTGENSNQEAKELAELKKTIKDFAASL